MKMLPEPLTTTAETAYGGLLHPLRPMEAARGVLSEPASVPRASVVVPGMPTGSHAAVAGGEPGVHRELQRHPVAPAYRVEHPLEERTCVVCGRPFTKRPNALVCGEECRRKRKMEQRKRRGPWRERSPDGVGGSPAVRSECAAVRGSLAMKAVSGDSLRPAAGAAGVPDSRGCSRGHHPRPRGRLARPKR